MFSRLIVIHKFTRLTTVFLLIFELQLETGTNKKLFFTDRTVNGYNMAIRCHEKSRKQQYSNTRHTTRWRRK